MGCSGQDLRGVGICSLHDAPTSAKHGSPATPISRFSDQLCIAMSHKMQTGGRPSQEAVFLCGPGNLHRKPPLQLTSLIVQTIKHYQKAHMPHSHSKATHQISVCSHGPTATAKQGSVRHGMQAWMRWCVDAGDGRMCVCVHLCEQRVLQAVWARYSVNAGVAICVDA